MTDSQLPVPPSLPPIPRYGATSATAPADGELRGTSFVPPPIPRYGATSATVPADGATAPAPPPFQPFQPTFGPPHPWGEAVHAFDALRAGIRRLPADRELAAWGRLLQHIEAATAEILAPPTADPDGRPGTAGS